MINRRDAESARAGMEEHKSGDMQLRVSPYPGSQSKENI
jgi:hypothetical protein